jgi:hypothetical protein
MSIEVELSNGGTAIVDDNDYDLVKGRSWYPGGGKEKKYAMSYVKNEAGELINISMHKLILGYDGPLEIDHRNGNGFDNTRLNLRIATRQQNASNLSRKVTCKSKYKGVVYRKDAKLWRATLTKNWKQISLGYYKTEEEAAVAYNAGALKHFGEFARLNVIA